MSVYGIAADLHPTPICVCSPCERSAADGGTHRQVQSPAREDGQEQPLECGFLLSGWNPFSSLSLSSFLPPPLLLFSSFHSSSFSPPILPSSLLLLSFPLLLIFSCPCALSSQDAVETFRASGGTGMGFVSFKTVSRTSSPHRSTHLSVGPFREW